MECGKPGGKPDAGALPPCETLTVAQEVALACGHCQRTANGGLRDAFEKGVFSQMEGVITNPCDSCGQRISSSLSERGEQGLCEGVGGDGR